LSLSRFPDWFSAHELNFFPICSFSPSPLASPFPPALRTLSPPNKHFAMASSTEPAVLFPISPPLDGSHESPYLIVSPKKGNLPFFPCPFPSLHSRILCHFQGTTRSPSSPTKADYAFLRPRSSCSLLSLLFASWSCWPETFVPSFLPLGLLLPLLFLLILIRCCFLVRARPRRPKKRSLLLLSTAARARLMNGILFIP